MDNDVRDYETKSEKREEREKNRRKMKISGKSVRLIHEIIGKRANKARRRINGNSKE